MTKTDENGSEITVCPDCGSEDLASHGKEWRCRDCGRWTLKTKRPPRKPNYCGPPCIDCGSILVVSAGDHWNCTVCHRYFTKYPKQRLAKSEFPPEYLNSIQSSRSSRRRENDSNYV